MSLFLIIFKNIFTAFYTFGRVDGLFKEKIVLLEFELHIIMYFPGNKYEITMYSMCGALKLYNYFAKSIDLFNILFKNSPSLWLV